MARDPKQTELELDVFACFLEAYPSFAAEVASYEPGAEEPADIAVRLKNGGSIGFQLGQWVHELQMGEAKRKKRLRAKLQLAGCFRQAEIDVRLSVRALRKPCRGGAE